MFRPAPHLVPFGHSSGHNELDHPAFVAFRGHGLAKRFHGILVGFAQQRLPINSNQLVVHPKPPVLLLDKKRHILVFYSAGEADTA